MPRDFCFKDSVVPLLIKPRRRLIRLVDAFQALGFAEPIVYGGVLRDQVLGIQPKDIDVRIALNSKDIDADEDLLRQLSTLKEFSVVSERQLQCLGGTSIRYRHELKFEGEDVDLIHETDCPDVNGIIRISDAPINSVAIDPDDKSIKAHPSFLRHSRERIYAPRDGVTGVNERFQHLSSKVQGLSWS